MVKLIRVKVTSGVPGGSGKGTWPGRERLVSNEEEGTLGSRKPKRRRQISGKGDGLCA